MQQFNASVIISEQLNRLMVNAAQELAQRAVSACAEHYKFDAEEAIGLLGLNNVKLERKGAVKEDDGEKAEKKVDVPKPKFLYLITESLTIVTATHYARIMGYILNV